MKAFRFVHLNVHSHYSINDGCASIRELVDAAIKERMPGIAITDTGNMFGIMEFFDYVSQINIERQEKGKKPFKPIIGCELYVAKNGFKEQKDGHKDLKGFHLTVLAKNLIGYKNLMKIVSNSWTDGFYGSPRTDRADLEKYHEGLIVLSGSVGSEVFNKVVCPIFDSSCVFCCLQRTVGGKSDRIIKIIWDNVICSYFMVHLDFILFLYFLLFHI